MMNVDDDFLMVRSIVMVSPYTAELKASSLPVFHKDTAATA